MSVLENPSTEQLNLRAGPASGYSTASDRKRQANEFMRAGLAHFDATERIPFFCECGWERCFKPVWLTSTEYDNRRQTGAWRPLVEGHSAGGTPSRAD